MLGSSQTTIFGRRTIAGIKPNLALIPTSVIYLSAFYIMFLEIKAERVYNTNIWTSVQMFVLDPMENISSFILDEHISAHVAELFRVFSDTSRVRILSALVIEEMNIGALAALLGISESAISHHMRGLRQMRVVQSRRDGKEVYYRIEDEHIIALFKQGVNHVQNG